MMAPPDAPLLTVQDLHVRIPTTKGVVAAVRGVSFSVGREKLGIVGESGSGKTMTGRAILRLVPPPGETTASAMRFGDRDLLRARERELRGIRGRRIAMVMQDPKFSLNPVMPVGRQVAEAYRVHSRAGAAEAEAKAMEMLRAVRI
ncbi:MAG: ATP-binding cassette domain-containing protein, partial [Dongiaceae bacterium]